jgi:AmmeMemoRadiSam system protein A
MTEPNDRATLLRIAREAIDTHVTGAAGGPERAAPRMALSELLRSRIGGAFVTIHHRGDLRGCVGRIDADQPLVHIVARCAVSACSADPRFAPIGRGELVDIDVELSLLGPLEPITGPDDIEIVRHGLVVARDGRRGLLLPQVAAEWKWDAPTFLTQTCRKAGLPADAWRSGAMVWRFEAEVFGENDHCPSVSPTTRPSRSIRTVTPKSPARAR